MRPMRPSPKPCTKKRVMLSAFTAVVFGIGCRGAAPPPAAPSPPIASPISALVAEGGVGVEDPRLADLLRRHWDYTLAENPIWATTLGDHRFDDRIPDNSPEALYAARQANRRWLAEAKAIPPASLSAADRTTLALFVEELESAIASEVCAFEEWNVSTSGNPVARWNYLPQQHRVDTPLDGRNLILRYRAIPRAIDHEIAHLRRGVQAGRFAAAETVRRVIAMVERQLAAPLGDWALLEPLKKERPAWTAAEREAFARDLRAAVEEGIRPAFERYVAFLRDEVLPRARPDDRVGLGSLPDGASCYAARIRAFTTLSKDPRELHALGLAEIARINDEMRTLGEKLFGTRDLAAILERLRTDPALYFQTEEEIEAKAKSALAAAKAKMREAFGILPKADCVVARIPAYEAPFTTIAYYQPPHYDGSKPGEYYVNVSDPKTRPRYEAEALAFHESIPGHHLQIAIAQELPALPAFRKHGGVTAFVEGWALYTERLADELGLYSSDLDRMGMLSYDAWRAARLVVDTGIHALGWSRERAVKFMWEHTALAENNIRNEVDRYIVWPGQALAYKVGQLEIWRLRREAEKTLGKRFDRKGFHDAVLGRGAVTLGVLAEQVEAWVNRVRAEAEPAATR